MSLYAYIIEDLALDAHLGADYDVLVRPVAFQLASEHKKREVYDRA